LKAATIALFQVGHLSAKHKELFNDRGMLKDAFLEAGDSLFDSFKNKSESTAAVEDLTALMQNCHMLHISNEM
jgi:hypothetical protein